MAPEVQKPAQESYIVCLLNTRNHNLLRAKHFHGVSFGSQHEHLLKSCYGKVRYYQTVVSLIVVTLRGIQFSAEWLTEGCSGAIKRWLFGNP